MISDAEHLAICLAICISPLENVCSIPLPIFKSDFFVFLLLNGRNSLYILQINLLSDICSQSLSHVWLCHPMDCNPPGSSVHGIFLVRILEWVAISSSRGTSWPRDRTHNSEDSYLADGVFTTESIYRMGEIFGDHIRPVVLKYFPHSVKWLFILMCRNFLVCCSSACWFCIFFFFCIKMVLIIVSHPEKMEGTIWDKIVYNWKWGQNFLFISWQIQLIHNRRKVLSDHHLDLWVLLVNKFA